MFFLYNTFSICLFENIKNINRKIKIIPRTTISHNCSYQESILSFVQLILVIILHLQLCSLLFFIDEYMSIWQTFLLSSEEGWRKAHLLPRSARCQQPLPYSSSMCVLGWEDAMGPKFLLPPNVLP